MVVRNVSDIVSSCTRSFGSSDIKSWLGRSMTLLGEGIAKHRLAACGAGTFAVLCVVAVIYRRSNRDPFSSYHTENLTPFGVSRSLLTIHLFRKDLQARPDFHLHAFCDAIQQYRGQVQDCQMTVHYIKEKSLDAAGSASRDYLCTLTESLISKLQPHFAKQPQGFIPSAENLSAPLAQIFKNLGRLMMYCYLSTPYCERTTSQVNHFFIGRFTGLHFDNYLFDAVLHSATEDIDSGEISFKGRIKIYTAFVNSRKGTVQGSLQGPAECLWQIVGNDGKPPLDYGQFITRLAPGTIAPQFATDETQKQTFETLIRSAIRHATTIDPKTLVEPILMIAKGMKEFYLLNNKDQKNNWREFVEEVLHLHPMSHKIQGTPLTPEHRQLLVDYHISANEQSQTADFLVEWIQDPNTSDEHIKLFLRFVTGTTTFVHGQTLYIEFAKAKGLAPRAETATCTLTFPAEPPDGWSALPLEEQKRRFIDCLVQEIQK